MSGPLEYRAIFDPFCVAWLWLSIGPPPPPVQLWQGRPNVFFFSLSFSILRDDACRE